MYITSFTLQYLLTCNLSLRCPWNKVEIGILYYFTGKDGKETSKVTLHKFFHKDFERSETDTYKVEEEDVGDVVMVTLINHVGFRSDWFVAKIAVEKEVPGGSEKYEFPCYRWVVRQLVVYEGKGT